MQSCTHAHTHTLKIKSLLDNKVIIKEQIWKALHLLLLALNCFLFDSKVMKERNRGLNGKHLVEAELPPPHFRNTNWETLTQYFILRWSAACSGRRGLGGKKGGSLVLKQSVHCERVVSPSWGRGGPGERRDTMDQMGRCPSSLEGELQAQRMQARMHWWPNRHPQQSCVTLSVY